MHKNLYLLFTFFFMTCFVFSQDVEEKENTQNESILKGKIIDGITKAPLVRAHVFNLNTVVGSATTEQGDFEITAKANDTIFVSHLGYQPIKLKITNDLLKGNELVISMFEKTIQISEVNIKAHDLVGVLEVDVKNIPEDKYTRIHINGLKQTYEVGKPRKKTFSSPVDAIYHPVDFLYNLFGKKPKELKKLRKLKDEDSLRKLLESKFNRDLMMEYLNLSKTELDNLLDDCNYSRYFIEKASDLQVIEAVLECYEKHKAVKTGSTQKR
ncbi:carboxypeptidase-like regulatory domain-containing protein [Aureivirga sp. CE67]|uniref:carboxypeptidase-like regulatory domain-containing protein n=1 Tax=Aureivirga sp. CE67 TaxID=1788983 RepID=UPI0018CAD490|nr:carboxypeptidase-like regulatory domain-containing protein [Aureivirga sp. CE67]